MSARRWPRTLSRANPPAIDGTVDDLITRIDRLESVEAIRQLVSRYGMLLDRRDLDSLILLFTADIRANGNERGRAALRRKFDELCRKFTTSFHLIGNHVIDFIDADNAEGVVYCRAEHEYGEQWIVMAVQYSDRYERRDGEWLFAKRRERHWYAVDILDRPVGQNKTRWGVTGQHTLPGLYDSWHDYWAEPTR